MTSQELQGQYASALEEYQVLESRKVDNGTLKAALDKVMSVKTRLERARANEGQTATIDRLTGGNSNTGRGGNAGPGGRDAWGRQFIESETFKAARDLKNLRAGIFSSPVSELMSATLTEDAASGGDLVVADFRPGITAVPTRRLVVADLFPNTPTSSNAITYMKETTFTNAAAAVAEGNPKPESTLVFDAVTDPVRKIAHWLPVTEELVQDVPAMRGYIDARLRTGVELTEDDQLLNGSGTAPNIQGILNRSGLAADQARGSDTNADAIAKQIAAITTATNLAPDGIVMHPTNWLTIQLMKDSTGQYFGDGPFAAPQRPTLWGLPVALTTAIALNTALVGAFKVAGQIFRNGGLRVEVSNSHADFFVKNLLAIRAELRAALAIYRPAAFGKVTGLT